jgi:exopolysaccharide biosynthesis polyprenyl glycosylphosphotransferase
MSSADQRLVFDAEMAGFAAADPEPRESCADSAAETETRRRAAAQFRNAFGACAAAADFLAAGASLLLSEIFLRVSFFRATWSGVSLESSKPDTMALAAFAGLLVVLLNRGDRGYADGGSLLQIRETERALRSSTLALLLLLPLGLLPGAHLSLAAWMLSLLLAPVFLILEKQMLAAAMRKLHRQGRGVERVLVYGAGSAARRVVSALLDSPQLGMRPVAAIDDGSSPPSGWMFALGYRGRGAIPVRHGQAQRLLESCACEVLVMASENDVQEQAAEMARLAEQMGMRVVYLSTPGAQEWRHQEWLHADGLLLSSIADPPRGLYPPAKRAVDLLLASLLLVLLAPLLLAIALWVRLDSPGPAFFVQKRVGHRGRIFEIIKFRTMHRDAARYDMSPANPADARITRAGRFLRRTSLDELPQLFNVLAGDMSLVGPRPEMPFLVEEHAREHLERLQAVPGITGLWQLSADREFRIHENVHYDLYYIKNRSLFLDAAILIHTLLFAMRGV